MTKNNQRKINNIDTDTVVHNDEKCGHEDCGAHTESNGHKCCGHSGDGEDCGAHTEKEGHEGCKHIDGKDIGDNRKALFLDLSGGIRRGMLTAALLDLGVMGEAELLSSINSFSLKFNPVLSSIDCGKSRVKYFRIDSCGLTFAEGVSALNNSSLSTAVKQTAYEILSRLKETGEDSWADKENICGGLVSFFDIVSACILIERLNPAVVAATPVALGGGVKTAGNFAESVPVPLVTEIVKGINITLGGNLELTDPAGAAVITALTGDFEGNISGSIIGEGLGTAPDGKSVLRAILMETRGITGSGEITEINANIDNTTGEYLTYCAEELYKRGALDVWFAPVQSNKFRPAYMLGVLCEPEDTRAMSDIIFSRTRSIEVRFSAKKRIALPREDVLVKTAYGDVRVRIIYSNGTADYYPEFEDIKRISGEQGISIEDTAEEIITAVSKHFNQ